MKYQTTEVNVGTRDMRAKREIGHYWIKFKGKWTVGEWDSWKWAIPRLGIYKYDGDLDDVGHQVMREVTNGRN